MYAARVRDVKNPRLVLGSIARQWLRHLSLGAKVVSRWTFVTKRKDLGRFGEYLHIFLSSVLTYSAVVKVNLPGWSMISAIARDECTWIMWRRIGSSICTFPSVAPVRRQGSERSTQREVLRDESMPSGRPPDVIAIAREHGHYGYSEVSTLCAVGESKATRPKPELPRSRSRSRRAHARALGVALN